MSKNDFVQIVSTPSLFKVDDSMDSERFMKVRVAVMHSGENLNHSFFSTKVIEDAKDSFANIPILANISKIIDEDGNERIDFNGHDAHIEEDAFNEGEYKVIYDESVVGIIPETNSFEIVHDDETDNDYVYVDGLIYREYGNYAADIIESRGGTTDVSAEIYTPDISFDAESKLLVVNEMKMAGVTLLGEHVTPAMKGANATAFSINEDDLRAQMIKVMSDLKESLDKYNAAINGENIKKGGERSLKFEELLEKYGKTLDDITFEYEGLTDEELEAAFASAFEEADEEPVDDVEQEVEAEAAENAEEQEENFAKMSVNYNGMAHEFSISLQDKISALYELVNNTYADEDGTWYDVTVYDDERYVIMVNFWSGKGYKQSYKVKNDVYTLVGDRVEVFPRWLTQDEINSLDRMKADYSIMEEKLSHYEDEPKKLEILGSDDYSLIADNEDFVALCKQENHFNMSIDEVTTKADAILTAAAKQHKFAANVDENHPAIIKPIPTPKKKAKRFGSLFDGII